MNKGEPKADQRPAKNDIHQESMAVGTSEWQRDRDLTDDTAETDQQSGSLPPETPVNYRQRP